MGKNSIQRFIALALVFTLAYVQTVLVNHRAHAVQHVYESSKDPQVHSFVVKCVVCDYVFTKRSEPALLEAKVLLTIFSKTIPSLIDKGIINLPYTFTKGYSNRGPPLI